MQQVTRLFVRALLAGFTCFGVSGITLAQDKAKDAKVAPAAEKGKATTKVLLENEKVRITESTFSREMFPLPTGSQEQCSM